MGDEGAIWLAPCRHVGIWVLGFEHSQFLDGATNGEELTHEELRGRRSSWMAFDGTSRFPHRCVPVSGYVYRIDFVGRDRPTTDRRPGPQGFFDGYGHFGQADRLVMIDKVRSIGILRPFGQAERAPKPPVQGCGLPAA